jgi:hypothetical protein
MVIGQIHSSTASSWNSIPQHPFCRRLGGPQNSSEDSGDEKNLLSLPGIEKN